MNINQCRANDYSDWSKVCLALVYEQSGIQVAIDFSSRVSNPNIGMTRSLYEKGLSGTVKIGTLMFMLKEDNPRAFY